MTDAHLGFPHLGAQALLILAVLQDPRSRPATQPTTPAELHPVLDSGLRWLLEHREKDGHWRGGTSPGSPRPESDVFATSIAVAAFLGSGSTMAGGPHQEVVRSGLAWLMAQQSKDDGFLGPRAATLAMAGHAVATLVLSETAVLSPNEEVTNAAKEAMRCLLAAREPGAIWPRDPRGGPEDRWALGWAVMALRSLRDARVFVDEAAVGEVSAWLEQHTEPNRGPVPARPASRAITAETLAAGELLARCYLGQQPERNPAMGKVAEQILRRGPGPAMPGGALDAGFVYFGTMALMQVGGESWTRWSGALPAALATTQLRGGANAGSWDATTPDGVEMGRTGTTALLVLAGTICWRMDQVRAGR